MVSKCDGERQPCSNCIKSKRICGGYLQKQAFILYQGMLSQEPTLSRAFSDNQSESGALMAARWRVDPTKPSQQTTKLEIASIYRQRHHRTSGLPCSVSSHHAGRQQILDIFLTNHLPSEVLNDRGPINKQRHWLLLIQDSPSLTPALESSILAVCVVKLGRKHDDEALIHEGLSKYSNGLRQLQQALRNPKTRCDDETIAACMALILFECTHCPALSIESCIAHYQGAMNLLLLKAPEAYVSGLAHCVLQELRIQSVSARYSPFHSSVMVYVS